MCNFFKEKKKVGRFGVGTVILKNQKFKLKKKKTQHFKTKI